MNSVSILLDGPHTIARRVDQFRIFSGIFNIKAIREKRRADKIIDSIDSIIFVSYKYEF